MDLSEKLKLFPFRVRFPKAGQFNLLQWYTHNDGNHVILGKDEASVLRTWASVLKKYNNAEAKEYYRINVVSPPDILKQRFAEWNHRNERMSFRWQFAHPLKSYKELLKKLPPLVSLCKRAVNEEGEFIKKESEYDNPHATCVKCIDGFLVKGYTYDTLYEKLREKVFADEHRRETRKISEAPHPMFGTALYAVTEEPGHHRNGTGVEEVLNWENVKEDEPFPSTVHFFFQGVKHDIPASVTASIKEVNDAWEDRKKKDKTEHKKSNDKYNNELIKRVDDLMEGL